MRIVILAKAPRPGVVKTRLEPAPGAGWRRPAGGTAPAPHDWHSLRQRPGRGGGVREFCPRRPGLAAVAQRVLASGANLLLLGMDCAELEAHHLHTAAAQLSGTDAALIPSLDGGYVLLGLRRFHHALFHAVPWSTAMVVA